MSNEKENSTYQFDAKDCEITEVGMSAEIDGQCEVTRYMFDKPIVVKSDGMLIIKRGM